MRKRVVSVFPGVSQCSRHLRGKKLKRGGMCGGRLKVLSKAKKERQQEGSLAESQARVKGAFPWGGNGCYPGF